MIFLLPVFWIISIFFQISLSDYFKNASEFSHSICTLPFAGASVKLSLQSAFFCGQKVTDIKLQELLIKSGIYHVVVVSGSHFIWIEKILTKAKLPLAIRYIALFFYYLASGLQPPGLRSFVHVVLSSLLKKSRPVPSHIVLLSGSICLVLDTHLWQSCSFWLSWQISMILALYSEVKSKNIANPWLESIIVYTILSPALFFLGSLHPFSIFLGVILVPIFSIYLTLTSLIWIIFSGFTPGLSDLFQSLHDTTLNILKIATQPVTLEPKTYLPLNFLWIYFFAIFSLFYFWKTQVRTLK